MSADQELIEAAEAVIVRWYSPKWKDEPHTAEVINRLRAALAAKTPQLSIGTPEGQRVYSLGYARGRAKEREVLAAKTEAPADPMDWPLPCDVTVGCGTHGKGTKLRGLVARMRRLYDAVRQHDDADKPKLDAYLQSSQELDAATDNFYGQAAPAMAVEPVAVAWKYRALAGGGEWRVTLNEGWARSINGDVDVIELIERPSSK